ncbi:thermostable hemolysin [uncultured Phenylobacterium sp.]|uniref:thermostable hemolysin n=1 Tax=uncultured Phenylobacterium sp. TaxID=349273 RepID=UPI0025DB2AE5|nr:thermostable hemolysin [uncultured Phenylobacterium sp.]
MVVADPSHPRRAGVERYIEARFDKAFGARVLSHYPTLTGLCGPEGSVLAAAGVRFAETEPLFLERYLDGPVERVIAEAFERPVARDSVVEIGSFASDTPAASLQLFHALAAWLGSSCGRRFAVATARPDLQRLLGRAGFDLRSLVDADPACLGEGARDWGTYYDRSPRVFAAEIGASAVLPQLRRRLRARSMARAVRRMPSVTL